MTKSLIKFILLIAVVVTALLFMGSCTTPHAIDGAKNKRVMLEYVKQVYGNDYKIVYEYLGKSGASGRRKDYVVVDLDGLEFEVYAVKQKVIYDFYNKRSAERMMAEYLKNVCIAEDEELDFIADCEIFSTIYEYIPKRYSECEEILADKDLKIIMSLIIFTEKSIEDIKDSLFDYYSAVCENFEGVDLQIRVDTPSNKELYSKIQYNRNDCSYYEYWANSVNVKKGNITMDEFLGKFKRY